MNHDPYDFDPLDCLYEPSPKPAEWGAWIVAVVAVVCIVGGIWLLGGM
ncbi:MAG: hypothetical protein KGL39_44925 [Patescibacteria group bacterium]|nr:hypothetical protein [Patescibacteria group bacterium]